jgi:hypothetical protein
MVVHTPFESLQTVMEGLLHRREHSTVRKRRNTRKLNRGSAFATKLKIE